MTTRKDANRRPKVRIINSGARGAIRRRVTGFMAEKTKVEWADYALTLEAAILRHRRDVWGIDQPILHDADVQLYKAITRSCATAPEEAE